MKTRKNLMVLVLLSLFLSVGVADSNVTDGNVTVSNIEKIKQLLAERKKAKAENAAARLAAAAQ